MKTILHVIDTTGPGGAETIFVDLAAGLDSSMYRSVALIRGPGWVQTALEARRVKTFILDCKGSFNVRYLWQLLSLIRAEQVDIVQAHLFGSGVYCGLAGLLAGKPVIATLHGTVDVGASERFLAAKCALLRFGTRKVVAVSRALATMLASRSRLPPSHMAVIYNGIETARYDRQRSSRLKQQLMLPESAMLVGALGNIRPAKDYRSLLAAFSRVAARDTEACLVIAGEGKGSLLAELKIQRANLGLENRVHFIGYVDDPADYLGNLDVFVLSSSTEGFSIATIQAMAAGVPVVATRCGGPEEIVSSDEYGVLVPAGDADALAGALIALMESPERRRTLAAAAKVVAQRRFDIAKMVSEYEALYGQRC
jgi:glycosyltransferase involved in cell wall biosynthesis